MCVDIQLHFGRRERGTLASCSEHFAAATDSKGDIFSFFKGDELTKNYQDDPNSADGRMYAKRGNFCNLFVFLFIQTDQNDLC